MNQKQAWRRILVTSLVGMGVIGLLGPSTLAGASVNSKGSVPMKATSVDTKTFREISDFSGGTHAGVTVSANGLTLDTSALLSGTDTLGRYNGGAYQYGQYTSDVIPVNFKEAIASIQANTAPGTWTEVELSAEVDGVWSKWYSMGVWLEGSQPFKRHSVNGQGDTVGTVYTDTLSLKKAATAVRARVTLFTTDPTATPSVRDLGITFANGTDTAGAVPSTGLVSDLAVPKRSQMVFPNGGEVWCSPTSTSMVMAYWSNLTGNAAWNQTVPTVVNGVWDYTYNGGGNWPFNTNYASSFGLVGKVARMSSLAEIEQWTNAGVPVIVSIAYKKGQLDNSPIPSSAGHLLVVRGFDAAGNVLTNDPAAASDDKVGITYNRLQFEQCWLGNSNGTTYLIYPQGWAVPSTNGHW
ncbi:C39 family peptidase [Tumebacillus sp. ITR2]|uniref:C39 family peptidase n=1 Tax=Tumebacillus amylolyticus TaxID=2801339 RepID=A0ABS1J4T4_9BACL|nr:C39 family peptidase [Tumebacillus amylolyticus]MBL0385190.1 C39 family peptidase [Tumebacillus amylolyticus]